MRAIAATVAIAPGKPGFSCYDPTLAERLTQAAVQADQPAELKLREAVFNEGPAGVANAVKNLWRNVGTYGSSLVAYILSGGRSDGGRTDGGEPITGRDLIALLATIGIDLGLLVLAILNPPREPPSIRPSGALTRQINDAIDTVVTQVPDVDRQWIRSHFIHHYKASYLIIPNLYSCDPNDKAEAARGVAMNQLAGVLSDLELVTWPKRAPLGWRLGRGPFQSELQKLQGEEGMASDTDLTKVRKAWLEAHGADAAEGDDLMKRKAPIRNHGLFSKAERALQIAGWSERARSDLEVFRLVETEGLTPLLMILGGEGSGMGSTVRDRKAPEKAAT